LKGPPAPNSLADVGPLGHQPFSDSERDNRTAFAKLWTPTIKALEKRKWSRIHPGSISQLYVEDGPSGSLDWCLASVSNEFLYLRLNFFEPSLLRAAASKFRGLVLKGYDGMTSSVEKARRASGDESFLEFRIGMTRLFMNCSSSKMMADRLRAFVVPLIDLASENIGLTDELSS
jgi:hypothetical protein